MIWPIVLMAVLSLNSATAAEAYKCKGKNGETIFSDQPCAKNAELIELKEPQTYAIPAPPVTATPAAPSSADKKEKITYTEFVFSAPKPGAIYDDGSGNVRAALLIKPRLDYAHKVQFFLNNAALADPERRAEWSFNNLERGDYELRAELVDQNGKVIQSASTHFAVVKHLPKKKS